MFVLFFSRLCFPQLSSHTISGKMFVALGHPKSSKFIEGMFSFVSKPFSINPPLYASTLSLSILYAV